MLERSLVCFTARSTTTSFSGLTTEAPKPGIVFVAKLVALARLLGYAGLVCCVLLLLLKHLRRCGVPGC